MSLVRSRIKSNVRLVSSLKGVSNERVGHSIEKLADCKSDNAVIKLWLCVYLPRLAVEIQGTNNSNHQHRIVYEELKGKCLVYRASQLTENKGVKCGMSLDAARILCPELEAKPRQSFIENNKMQELADWAYEYSSDLSVINNDMLVLEVGGSEKLYKGLEALWKKMGADLSDVWELSYCMAISSTPLASMMLARQNISQYDKSIITYQDELRSTLGRLPVDVLLDQKSFFNARDIKSLNNMGVVKLADLWRLPTKELLQRFGKDAMEYFDRLLGSQSDPQFLYKAPKNFNVNMELPLEVNSNKLVLQALERLVIKLVRYLKSQDSGVRNLKISLSHCRLQATCIDLSLHEAMRDGVRINALITERFNRVNLPAPVIEVSLESGHIEAYETSSNDLFEYDASCADVNSENRKQAWDKLLSSLDARLGEKTIKTIVSRKDYRPERAWQYRTSKKSIIGKKSKPNNLYKNKLTVLMRPSWLLPIPRKLKLKRTVLFDKTPVELLHGPERIESGWWDGHEIRRDYYIARDEAGSRLWIFCDLKKNGHWYVHGLFA